MRQGLLDKLLGLLISYLKTTDPTPWQEVEATLHCIRFASEAVPLGETQVLPIVFSQEVFERLPKDDGKRVQLAAIRMIRTSLISTQ